MAESPVQVEAPPKVENSNNSKEIPSTAHMSVLSGGDKIDPLTGRGLSVNRTFSIGAENNPPLGAPSSKNGTEKPSAPAYWEKDKSGKPLPPKPTFNGTPYNPENPGPGGVKLNENGEIIEDPVNPKPNESATGIPGNGIKDTSENTLTSDLPPSSLYNKEPMNSSAAETPPAPPAIEEKQSPEQVLKKIKTTKFSQSLRNRVVTFIKNFPNKKLVFLLPLILAAQHDRARNVSIDQAAKASEPPAKVVVVDKGPSTNWMDSDLLPDIAPPDSVYGPKLSELQETTDTETTSIEYKSGGDHYTRGLVEDLVMQAVNPYYAKFSKETRDSGVDTPVKGDLLNGTKAAFINRLKDNYKRYGMSEEEAKTQAEENYDKTIKALTSRMIDTINTSNKGPDGKPLEILDPNDPNIIKANVFNGLSINENMVVKALEEIEDPKVETRIYRGGHFQINYSGSNGANKNE